MAIVQISRITQRKGLQEDLPQPLAGAELGWSTDQRRLFIGNGTVEEGAPVVGNTEILTEFSDILEFTSSYTYKGEAAGYVAQTGITPGSPISQSLQQRLDSFVVVTDFGATGNGTTDDTAAINRALYQMYCVQTNPQIRRGLFFPAGVYKITDTILIPPYAKLCGDGSDSSILLFEVSSWVSGTAYSSGILVKNEEGGGAINYYRSLAEVPALLNGSPVLLTDTDYWESTSLPEYAFNTCDNLQQTGSSIGLNNATSPQMIELSDLALATSEYGNDSSLGHNLFLLDRVSDSKFTQCSLYGPLTTENLDNSIENLSLLSVESTTSLPVKSITFDKCTLRNATYACNTANLAQRIIWNNCVFDTLYQGLILGDASPANGGPTGCRVIQSTFDNIFAEAVKIDTVSLNGTAYNVFYDVGNHFNGSSSPATPCISINSDDNISVGDMFERNDTQATNYPRIKLWDVITETIPASIAFTNAGVVHLGSFARFTGQQTTLTNGATNQPLFTVDTALSASLGGFSSFRMDYTIRRVTQVAESVRTGVMVIVAGGDDSAGNGLVYTDDYTENQQTDVMLSVSESSDVITVSYSAQATTPGEDGIIYYSISSLG